MKTDDLAQTLGMRKSADGVKDSRLMCNYFQLQHSNKGKRMDVCLGIQWIGVHDEIRLFGGAWGLGGLQATTAAGSCKGTSNPSAHFYIPDEDQVHSITDKYSCERIVLVQIKFTDFTRFLL